MHQLPGRIACNVRAGWRREMGLAIYCIVVAQSGWVGQHLAPRSSGRAWGWTRALGAAIPELSAATDA